MVAHQGVGELVKVHLVKVCPLKVKGKMQESPDVVRHVCGIRSWISFESEREGSRARRTAGFIVIE